MTDKALISDLTWRSLEMQKAAFPDMPHFVAPHETHLILRKTQRNGVLYIHVMSLAVIANNGEAFEDFWRQLPKNSAVHIQEDNIVLESTFPIKKAKAFWWSARRFGIAKIGGRISAEKKEAKYKRAISLIADRWPKPSKDWPTHILLKEAGLAVERKKVSYNTAIKYLGKRPIVQANYQAAQKRKERRNAKAN